MKTLIAATAAATLALGSAPVSAETRAEKAEAKFVELTEGRVAGESQSCISAFNSHRVRVIEHVGLAYERGNTLWIARVSSPNQLDHSDIPVIERHGSRLCRNDVMRTVDRYSGNFSGALFLEEFVPYTRVEQG